ncbi:MAG: ABC transporter permease, partial [Candidatus Sifarchaeia archaeon]
MKTYILQRVVLAVISVWFILILAFTAIRLIPGDPVLVYLGDYATPELIQEIRKDWGLDRPIQEQYFIYMKKLLKGDLGHSLRMGGKSVSNILLGQYPYTLRLVIISMMISLSLAIPLGMLSAVKHNSFIDLLVMTKTFFFLSMPTFWFGLLMLVFFSLYLGWFPAIGSEDSFSLSSYFKYLTLPAICLGLHGTA